MNTWRGLIVILVSAVAAVAAVMGWLVLNVDRLYDPWSVPMSMQNSPSPSYPAGQAVQR